jgi:biotin-(acetyl-CoA carboxylase) ligase
MHLWIVSLKDIIFGITVVLHVKVKWLDSAYNLNMPVSIHFKGKRISGIFEGIDDVGSLLMRLEDGQLHKLIAGEVFFE